MGTVVDSACLLGSSGETSPRMLGCERSKSTLVKRSNSRVSILRHTSGSVLLSACMYDTSDARRPSEMAVSTRKKREGKEVNRGLP
jgi:hypothetical protein